MENKDFTALDLLEKVAEAFLTGVRAMKAGAVVNADAVPVKATAEKKAPRAAKAAKKARRLSAFAMAKKVLKKSETPLTKDEILAAIKANFGTDVKKGSLSVAFNSALKAKKIYRAARGKYTMNAAEAEAVVPAPEEPAPVAAAPAAPVENDAEFVPAEAPAPVTAEVPVAPAEATEEGNQNL